MIPGVFARHGRRIVAIVTVLCTVVTVSAVAGDDPSSSTGDGVEAVDTVSMASPNRETIWTARLFFIAVNDRDEDTLYALFADDATITVEEPIGATGTMVPTADVDAASRRAWLERSIVEPRVRLRNRGGAEVDGRTATVESDWTVDETSTTVVIVFEQSEDGRIATMRIAPHRSK